MAGASFSIPRWSPMLWLALHLPWLPLEALPCTSPLPRCVIEQRQVLVMNRAAREVGVEIGMSASSASSLAPQVQQLLRDEAREAEFVRALALALSRYTPNVVLLNDGVLLEASASLRLFGGVRSLIRQVRATVRDCAAHARLGLARSACSMRCRWPPHWTGWHSPQPPERRAAPSPGAVPSGDR